MGQEKRYIQMQLDAQKDENQLNRDWQTAEAEKAREYQTSEREASQDFSSAERLASQQYQTEQWQRQFDIESNWNSEGSKAARLRAVGVNPQIALGNAGTQMLTVGNVSAPSGPSPSAGHSPMPAPVSGLSPVSAQPDELRVASILNSIGDIAKNFQDVLKGGAETKWLNESFPKRLEQLVNDVDLQGLKKEEYKIANALMNVDLTYSEEKQLAEIRKLQADGNKLVSEGKNFDELAKLNEKMQSFYQVLTQKEDYNSQLAALEVKYYIPKVNAYFENLNSQNASNYAVANEKNASAEFTKYRLSFEKALEANNLDRAISEADNAYSQSLIAKNEVDATKYAAQQSKVAADHAEATFWKDFALDLFQGGVDALLGYRNSKSWSKMSDASKLSAERKIEEMKLKYGDTSTDTYSHFDSQGRKHTQTNTYHTSRRRFDN